MTDTTGNEELTKSLATLSETVQSMREELATLKCRATQSGAIPPSTSSQHSNFEFSASSSLTSPPHKRSRLDNDGGDDEDEPFDEGDRSWLATWLAYPKQPQPS